MSSETTPTNDSRAELCTSAPPEDPSSQAEAPEPVHFELSATVTVINSSGVRIEKPTIRQAITAIRKSHRDHRPPLVGLASSVLAPADDIFTPSWWIVGATDVHTITTAPTQPVDYQLAYHGWTLTAEGRSYPVRRDALRGILDAAAKSMDRDIILSGDLLGMVSSPLEAEQSTAPQTSPPDSPAPGPDSPGAAAVPEAPTRALPTHFPSPTKLTAAPTANAVSEGTPTRSTPVAASPAPAVSATSVSEARPERADTPTDSAAPRGTDPEPIAEVPPTSLADQLLGPSTPDEPSTDEDDLPQSTDDPMSDHDDPDPHDIETEAQPEQSGVRARLNPVLSVRAGLGAAALLVLILAASAGLWNVLSSSSTSTAGTSPSWITTAPEATRTTTALDADHTREIWTLDRALTEQFGWTAAGLTYIDPETAELVLLHTTSGDETARIALDSPVSSLDEFITADGPAVGARTEDGFTLITGEGETYTWELAATDRVTSAGETPMVRSDDGTTAALLPNNDEPLEVTGHPDNLSAAIDDTTLIQVVPGQPSVVSIAFGPDAEPATETRLTAPTETAEFSRHITAGRGLTLSQWTVDGEALMAVHHIKSGDLTAVLPDHDPDSPTGWSIGRGMEIAIIGPYAIDISTGTLHAVVPDSAESGAWQTAIGPAAVAETTDGRIYATRDGRSVIESPSTRRIVGWSGDLLLVRDPSGDLQAVEEPGGTV
ncbi:hypothetical protein [Nesterenkonia sp. K-15-9-6]|uniref:hypothetical protein n=1 Tax=Nesterenkonia sp. K-15-9-6 TaxID=3093918 RepID=UPI0040446458